MKMVPRVVLLLTFNLALTLPAAAQQVSGGAKSGPIEVSLMDDGLSAKIQFNGKLFAQYLGKGYAKPIIYPIIGPGETNMVRNWPIKDAAAGEAKDHPHHTSLWYTHGAVNGIDFWAQGQGKGTIVPTGTLVVKATGSGETGNVAVTSANQWRGPDGKVVLTDERVVTFHLLPDDNRAIDFRVTLIASEGEVTFGDTKEGSMGIRTHPALRLKGPVAKGKALNSEGIEDGKLWGKRAAWVDYWAPIDGKTIGMAIFDHPSNPRHPTHWHARDYGLVAANPFGIHDFEKKGKGAGDMVMKKGDKASFNYRFLFHKGDVNEAKIAEAFKEFSK